MLPAHQQAELAALLNVTAIERAQKSLLAFTMYTMPTYEEQWFTRLVCEYLRDWITGRITRLIISMPPRHGKSELVSRRLPAFILGRNPSAQVMTASYSPELASTFNRDVQRIISDERYLRVFPRTLIAKASQTKVRNSSIFEIENASGFYRSAGVGGSFTGMGATHLIIDDPIKNRKDADSRANRETLWNWWTSTAFSRLEKDGRVLVTATRWHEDDLTGRLLSTKIDGEPWTVVNLPAIALEAHDKNRNNRDTRAFGEALWPSKFPVDVLAQVQSQSGSRDWNALWQGQPTAAGGTMVKESYFRYFTTAPKGLIVIQTWDLAFKKTTQSDYNVGLIMMKHENHFYLLDLVRFRGDFPEALVEFERMCEKWPSARRKYVEDKANGPALIASLKGKIPGIKPWSFDGDKISRLNSVLPELESGFVHLPTPESAPWVKDFLAEVTAFPNGANDDQVDALAMALMLLGNEKTRRLEELLKD